MGFETEIADAGSSHIHNAENVRPTAYEVICLTQSRNYRTLRFHSSLFALVEYMGNETKISNVGSD